MRALIGVTLLSSACTSLLGISDPTPATAGDGGPDSSIDSNIDAPPPCAPPVAFKAEQTSAIGATGTGFVIGRFDLGNNNVDIAIATGTNVVILHGDGAGNFGGDGLKPVIPTAAVDLVAEDFDSEGDDDLVMWTPTAVTMRRLNRALDPPVEAEQPLTGPFTNVTHVFQEQLDGNLRPDVMVYDTAAGSRVYTSNLGTPGTFARDANLVGTGADEMLRLQQVDGMQRVDAVFVNGTAVNLSVQTSSFSNPVTIGTGATSKGIALGKFDADTSIDLLVSTTNGLTLFRQMTPGMFTMHGAVSPVQSPTPMLVGDFNDDGRDDILTPTAAILQCAPVGNVGVFTQVESFAVGPIAKLVDVNGDTKLDLVRIDGTNLKVRLK